MKEYVAEIGTGGGFDFYSNVLPTGLPVFLGIEAECTSIHNYATHTIYSGKYWWALNLAIFVRN